MEEIEHEDEESSEISDFFATQTKLTTKKTQSTTEKFVQINEHEELPIYNKENIDYKFDVYANSPALNYFIKNRW